MARNLRNDIVNHLIKKGNYEPEVDDYLIDLIIKNLEYAKQMTDSIDRDGLIVSLPNGNGVVSTRINPALNIYESCLRNIHQCSVKLGISRNDRIKLKLLEEKKSDEFDNDFN